ncbi:MAG: glycoside hydrolase family 13 protein [Lachnospiraceae bacterium]|nr:glycoside hydrolase family 13 protein [Lachnospiraceae bacterium]
MHSSLLLNKGALFCDETEAYRIPAEPEQGDTVTIRFRTAADNVDHVYLITGGTEKESAAGEKKTASAGCYEMKKATTAGRFDYYETELTVGEQAVSYYFKITCDGNDCFYNKLGPDGSVEAPYSFRITPGFHAPQWAKGAVIYQIYTDRFCNGNPDNDVLTGEYGYINMQCEQVKDWNSIPSALDVCRFYGGDLQGVEAKLDYLQHLGVEVIYFNPMFVSPSNHKYDSQDYDYIDPHLAVIKKDGGKLLPRKSMDNTKAERYITRVTSRENLEASNEYFIALVEKIHARGMKVILDGVFNHCGSFNKWLDREEIYENQSGYEKGAYVSADSPYHDYFDFIDDDRWPYNDHYDGWWGHDTLPKLNYEGSRQLYDYILNVGKKWVSPPFNADGWRLDVAADLGHSPEVNHQFWRDFRKSVKEANPNAIILAEHYGDPSSWIEGDQWDTVMNYDAFMEPVTWFLTGMEKHSDEYKEELYGNSDWFFRTMSRNMSKFQRCSLDTAMNELSNHDHSRFLTRTNRTVGRLATAGADAAGRGVEKGVFRAAVVMQMTLPGAPTIYYADEAGQVGWTDPDNRRTYPWGKEDWELIEFHRYAIQIHKRYSFFRDGSYKPLAGGKHWLAYGRFGKGGQAVVLVNNNKVGIRVQIPVWQANVKQEAAMKRVMQTNAGGYNVGVIVETVHNGILEVYVGPQTATIYVAEEE